MRNRLEHERVAEVRGIAATQMKDYRAAAEKLRKDSAEAALIRDLATDKAKRELFDRLAVHLNSLAAQVEQALIEAGKSAKPS